MNYRIRQLRDKAYEISNALDDAANLHTADRLTAAALKIDAANKLAKDLIPALDALSDSLWADISLEIESSHDRLAEWAEAHNETGELE